MLRPPAVDLTSHRAREDLGVVLGQPGPRDYRPFTPLPILVGEDRQAGRKAPHAEAPTEHDAGPRQAGTQRLEETLDLRETQLEAFRELSCRGALSEHQECSFKPYL